MSDAAPAEIRDAEVRAAGDHVVAEMFANEGVGVFPITELAGERTVAEGWEHGVGLLALRVRHLQRSLARRLRRGQHRTRRLHEHGPTHDSLALKEDKAKKAPKRAPSEPNAKAAKRQALAM